MLARLMAEAQKQLQIQKKCLRSDPHDKPGVCSKPTVPPVAGEDHGTVRPPQTFPPPSPPALEVEVGIRECRSAGRVQPGPGEQVAWANSPGWRCQLRRNPPSGREGMQVMAMACSVGVGVGRLHASEPCKCKPLALSIEPNATSSRRGRNEDRARNIREIGTCCRQWLPASQHNRTIVTRQTLLCEGPFRHSVDPLSCVRMHVWMCIHTSCKVGRQWMVSIKARGAGCEMSRSRTISPFSIPRRHLPASHLAPEVQRPLPNAQNSPEKPISSVR